MSPFKVTQKYGNPGVPELLTVDKLVRQGWRKFQTKTAYNDGGGSVSVSWSWSRDEAISQIWLYGVLGTTEITSDSIGAWTLDYTRSLSAGSSSEQDSSSIGNESGLGKISFGTKFLTLNDLGEQLISDFYGGASITVQGSASTSFEINYIKSGLIYLAA